MEGRRTSCSSSIEKFHTGDDMFSGKSLFQSYRPYLWEK